MRSPFVVALTRPVVIAMLALSIVAGLCAAWWLFPIGLVLAAILIFGIANDPTFRMTQSVQNRAPLAQRFQIVFDRVERSQVAIFNTLASADPRIRAALEPIQQQANTITEQAYRLCQRMTTLENYRVVSQAGGNGETDLANINQQIANASDPIVKRENEESRVALESRLAKLKAVATQLDRVEAQLTGLANELDGALAEIVRLQGLGSNPAGRGAVALAQKLREQANELKTFEQDSVVV